MVVPLETTKTALTFQKGIPSTQSFDIRWSRWNCSKLGITHNLPFCFTIEPGTSDIARSPSQIKVTYNPSSLLTLPDESLWIRFRTRLADWQYFNQITITVRVLEEEKLYERPRRTQAGQKPSGSSKSDFFECQVCLLPYSEEIDQRTPRILSNCGHTLCLNCIETLHRMSDDRCSVTCPFDRKKTSGPVHTFPKNFVLIDLLREQGEHGEQTNNVLTKFCEDPDFPCFENARHEATKHCESCKVDFCNECFSSVHTPKVFSSHNAIPVELKPFEFPKCPVHPEIQAMFFCENKFCTEKHSLCCRTCVLEKIHKSHKMKCVRLVFHENEEKLRQILPKLDSRIVEVTEQLEKVGRCAQIKTHPTFQRHFNFRRKREDRDLLDGVTGTQREIMRKQKDQMKKDLGVIVKLKEEIEKTLRRKNTLFAQNMIERGEALCSLKAGNIVDNTPYFLPSRDGIIEERPSSSLSDISNASSEFMIIPRPPPPPPSLRSIPGARPSPPPLQFVPLPTPLRRKKSFFSKLDPSRFLKN